MSLAPQTSSVICLKSYCITNIPRVSSSSLPSASVSMVFANVSKSVPKIPVPISMSSPCVAPLATVV